MKKIGGLEAARVTQACEYSGTSRRRGGWYHPIRPYITWAESWAALLPLQGVSNAAASAGGKHCCCRALQRCGRPLFHTLRTAFGWLSRRVKRGRRIGLPCGTTVRLLIVFFAGTRRSRRAHRSCLPRLRLAACSSCRPASVWGGESGEHWKQTLSCVTRMLTLPCSCSCLVWVSHPRSFGGGQLLVCPDDCVTQSRLACPG